VAGAVVDMKVAPDGSLYYLDIFPGRLHQVIYGTASSAPIAVAAASVTEGREPLVVNFSSAGSADPDGDAISFRWEFGDGTSSNQANPVKTYTARGTYTVRLTVSDGVHQVQASPITISAGVRPTLRITAPIDGSSYRSGDTIHYGATAVDARGVALGDGAFTTSVLLHHGTHVHPFLGPLTSRTGTFTIPTTGEPAADTWYEVIITATDTDGLATTSSVNIRPIVVRIALASDVPGGRLLLDGVPTTTPYSTAAVVGFQREIAAPPTMVGSDGATWHFTGWSDGGAIRHTISTPATDTTYTAHYARSAPFVGEYFANRELAGAPVLTRQDPTIDFAWNLGAPAASVPADNFSVRWTKTQYFAAGTYRFTTISDDGVRLQVDGDVVIDQWHDQSSTVHETVVALDSGQHTVRLEYFDSGWDANAKLTWDTTTEQPAPTWLAEYWNTPGATASPAMPTRAADVSRPESAIDHQWWQAAPAPGIAADHFVARWTRVVALTAGTYEFAVTADDGVRLRVDGNLVLDRWIDQSASTHTAVLTLDAGPHTVVLEYYENAWDATAQLTWQRSAQQPTSTWLAEYWNTPGAGMAPAMPTRTADFSRPESAIDHQWWLAAPAPGIDADHFVARWTRVFGMTAGTYEFAVTADDGARLYVDGVLVIDRWLDQSASTHRVVLALGAGPHTVVLEYYENGWDATAKLDITHAG
jgi:PKD repeat protein